MQMWLNVFRPRGLYACSCGFAGYTLAQGQAKWEIKIPENSEKGGEDIFCRGTKSEAGKDEGSLTGGISYNCFHFPLRFCSVTTLQVLCDKFCAKKKMSKFLPRRYYERISIKPPVPTKLKNIPTAVMYLKNCSNRASVIFPHYSMIIGQSPFAPSPLSTRASPARCSCVKIPAAEHIPAKKVFFFFNNQHQCSCAPLSLYVAKLVISYAHSAYIARCMTVHVDNNRSVLPGSL